MNIIITPFNVINNKYIQIHKELFEEMGYDVVKITNAVPWNRSDNIFICNWLEDYLKGSGFSLFKNSLKFMLFCLYARIIAKKFICVRHNLKPHLNFKNEVIYKYGVRFLEIISDRVVYHGRYCINRSYQYIPHPLYEQKQLATDSFRDIEFAFYGAISKYKGIIELLSEWPEEKKLKIRGACNDKELINEISAIIKYRKLEKVVDIQYGFIQDEELNLLMQRTKYIILPHEDNSMIVSGAFYHGISYGANIIARAGKFSISMSELFDFCTIYNTGDLSTVITKLNYVRPIEVKGVAIAQFGKNICKEAWHKVLN